MTYLYYKTSTWTNNPQINDETIKQWEHLADKENWRITQLPNGYYQTEVSNPKNKEKFADVIFSHGDIQISSLKMYYYY